MPKRGPVIHESRWRRFYGVRARHQQNMEIALRQCGTHRDGASRYVLTRAHTPV